MDFCELHRVEYSNTDDECPICAREANDMMARGTA